MRRILVQVSGKTDANGNASFDLPLERTGDWRDIKVAVSTLGPAEWGLLTAGTALTYGRGRRATLGPELLEPFDPLTLQVLGGPPLAPISGAVTGVGGTMEEIIARYAPAPNTIALDTTAPIQALKQNAADSGIYTVAAGAVITNAAFAIPTGIQSVRFEINQLGALATWTGNTIKGNVTGKQYNTGATNPGTVGGFDETWELDPEDTALLFSINASGSANPFLYWLNGHVGTNYVATRIVQNFDGEPVFVRNDGTPAPWQAANKPPARFASTIASNATAVLVPAVVGQTVRLLSGIVVVDGSGVGNIAALEDTAGNVIGPDFGSTPIPFVGSGAALVTGRGVQILNADTVSHVIRVTLYYNQQ